MKSNTLYYGCRAASSGFLYPAFQKTAHPLRVFLAYGRRICFLFATICAIILSLVIPMTRIFSQTGMVTVIQRLLSYN